MNKKTSFYLILLLLYIIFNQQIISFYDKAVVAGFLKELNGEWLYWFVFVLTELTVYQLVYLYREKQKIPLFILFWITVFLVTYLYFRFFSRHYTFYSSHWAQGFKYADYFILLSGGIILLGLSDRLKSKRKPSYKDSPFIIDSPITKLNEDKFERKSFAILLAKKIQSKIDDSYNGSVAIGVNGSWGAGKTSFTNLIKAELDLKDRLIIDFNPWRSLTPTKIIEDFFKALTDKLKEFDIELSEDIESYAKSLTEIQDGIVSKSFKAGSQLLFGDKGSSINYDKINTSISKTGKQIIVFIDDLDRLDNKEIVEVLRLIRNTANFKNLVYVVAYDRNYVTEALRNINTHHFESYLEKIFQFEFSLPEYDPEVLRNNLKSDLNNAYTDIEIRSMLGLAIDYSGRSGKSFTNWIIKTQRDAIRLCNSFLFEIDGVLGEVNIIDFYLLQLLKLKYTKLFETVAQYKNVFFIQDELNMRLRKESERNSEITEFDIGWRRMNSPTTAAQLQEEKEDTPILHQYIDSLNKGNLKKLEISVIKEIFDVLLTEKDFRIGSESRDYKAFVNGENFEKYFTITQPVTQLSASEFEAFRLGDYNIYKGKINEWLDDPNKSDEVTNRLNKIVDFESRLEWENHLKILIYIGKKKYPINGGFGINYKQISETIAYPIASRVKIRIFDTEKAYKEYFAEFFKSAPEPYVFEGHILMAGLTGVDDFPLEPKEIEDILFSYFETYCSNHNEINTDFRQLHKVVVEKNDSYNYDYPIQARAQTLFLNYFKQHITICEMSGFIRLHDPFEKYYIFDTPWINYIFESFDNMINFLQTNENFDKDSDCYKEFMDYRQAVKDSPYPAIQYPFKFLFK